MLKIDTVTATKIMEHGYHIGYKVVVLFKDGLTVTHYVYEKDQEAAIKSGIALTNGEINI